MGGPGLTPDVILRVNKVLKHYGVKGMKWGVRRTKAQIDAASEEAARTSEIREKAARNKSLAPLSNKELQDAITRMNLERQYKQLTTKPPNAGQKFAQKMLGQVAQNEVQSLLVRGQPGPVASRIASKTSKT